ncbi:GDSL-type esterase/lipase family protein [Jeotgalibacillus sp. ET6]|uniref:DUF459 domain-containing protein n=1 Tax=Jeotgalibacillus sp. ET6 TaxID=3037260 RepID=UPI0024186862|nr:GDSL-type esterase/lipase family protein [Jeotgalibacillus sp. ET6]MDG5470545.1 GDSL-type esterase/lipase family protein [Jeotgalibacillus sp. ET6]
MKKAIVVGFLLFAVIIAGSILSGVLKSEKQPVEHQELVALGDSLTRGVGDQGQGYADNLENLLTEDQHHTVTVHNYGIPGQQSDGLLEQIKDESIRKRIKKAEYVIIFIGTNDLIESNGGDLTELNLSAIERGQKDYESNIKEILSIIRSENQNVPILMLGLYNPYPDIEELNEIVKDWNRTTVKVTSEEEQLKFISTNGLFEEKSTEYFSDKLHPNDKGYKLITKKIVEEYNF